LAAEKKKAILLDFYAGKRAKTYLSIPSSPNKDNLLSVGIPGLVAGVLYAEKKYGNLSRKQVMQPAIELARKGFPMYETLAQEITGDSRKLMNYQGSKRFLPNGHPFPVGKIMKRPKLAKALQQIADKGRVAFYNGAITEDMIKVLNKGDNPVTEADFKGYRVRTKKQPLVGHYKKWTVLSAAPPQTGMEVIEDLNLLDSFNLKGLGLPTQSDSAFVLLTSALRIGEADKAKYITDPRWRKVPTHILTSKKYAQRRSKSFLQFPVPKSAQPGSINNMTGNRSSTINDHNTTSLSTIDPAGNAVALTQTNSAAFGSGAWVDGFFMNNSGYNFSRIRDDSTVKVQADYRTRASTISPTIILNPDSTVKMVIGCAGGGHIPTSIVQSIVYMLDYQMDPMASLRMPRIYPSYHTPKVHIEKHFRETVLNKATQQGYKFDTFYGRQHGRVYVIEKKNGYWIGAADPWQDGGVEGY
jgi:gamma-glutamyltranspeptidase/glutathione hydrolase